MHKNASQSLITQVYRLPFDLVKFPKQECSKKHVDLPFGSWCNLRGNVLLLLTISNCLYCIFLITKPIHLKFYTQKEDKIVTIHKLLITPLTPQKNVDAFCEGGGESRKQGNRLRGNFPPPAHTGDSSLRQGEWH